MAGMFKHPKADSDGAEKFEFPCGGSVTITPPLGEPLTAKDAIYMLEDLKFQILILMRP